MGVDIALYTETNTDWQQPTTKQKHMAERYSTMPYLLTLRAQHQLGNGTNQGHYPQAPLHRDTSKQETTHLEWAGILTTK
jgi:hypothetical protein